MTTQEHQTGPKDTSSETQLFSVCNNALSIKEWLWLGILSAALLLAYFSPLKEHLTHLQDMKADLATFGSLAPLVFIVTMSALTAIGIPRMVMYPISGLAFGFVAGMIWSLIATVIGAYVTFLYARWAGRALVLKKWPALAHLTTKLDGRGFLSVALLRQMPSPGFLTNLLFGISSVRTRCFILGTALGSIPSAIPATLIGSSLSNASHDQRIWLVTTSIVLIVILWLVFGTFFRRTLRQK